MSVFLARAASSKKTKTLPPSEPFLKEMSDRLADRAEATLDSEGRPTFYRYSAEDQLDYAFGVMHDSEEHRHLEKYFLKKSPEDWNKWKSLEDDWFDLIKPFFKKIRG